MKKEFKGYANKSGVYRITNTINGKIYIGSAKRFKQRASEHISSLKNNKHQNKHLQASFNKYGTDAFLFEVIEVVPGEKSARAMREQEFIDGYLEDWEKCFNIAKKTIKKQGPWSKTPEESREKVISKRCNDWYLFLSSEDVEYVVEDLSWFCKQQKIDLSQMKKLSLGKNKQYQGWKSIKFLTHKTLVNKETKKEYKITAQKSLGSHSTILGIDSSHLSKLLSGKRKSIGNWVVKNRKIVTRPYKGKTYKLISPEGQVIRFNNLTRFAKENGLDRSSVFSLISGKHGKKQVLTHKGWIKYGMSQKSVIEKKKESYRQRQQKRMSNKHETV